MLYKHFSETIALQTDYSKDLEWPVRVFVRMPIGGARLIIDIFLYPEYRTAAFKVAVKWWFYQTVSSAIYLHMYYKNI